MTTKEKYDLTAETMEFNSDFQTNYDLIICEIEKDEHGFDSTTLLNITEGTNRQIKIRVDWCNASTTARKVSVMLIPEADKLFFATRFFWGVVDLVSVKIDRQESCVDFWSFERYSNTIVLTTELFAEALSLKGETTDKVPIDPPYECEEFDDRIEFDSPVYGHQVLKLKNENY
jgi:hypothetical protein